MLWNYMYAREQNRFVVAYQRYPNDTMTSAFPRSGFVVMCGIHSAVTGSYVAGYHSVLLINCPTEQTARDVGRGIMEKRLAACVNIFPRTATMYYWKGEIREASEILLLVRTRTSLIQRLMAYVKAVHPYDIPEIISFPIEDGSLHYLKWMEDAVPDI
ncbi:protein CutA homolog isoform X2 [Myxocyprinus asiaticus]|uniref:protein CutA homolog isoform X2 n=1 Tax=Myxocyprinus asiaticus TaxID=70543 RepID=UPI002222934B|nr:protein CutA homolog isoform X2 [Myxocyprinus asiaticus]